MDKNDKKRKSGNGDSGDITSWVFVFVLMVVFWPIGLLLLLIKMNIFTGPAKAASEKSDTPKASKRKAARTEEATDDPWDRAEAKAREAARNAAKATSGATSEIVQAVREAGFAARQALAELQAEFSQEFPKYKTAKRDSSQYDSSQYDSSQYGSSQYGAAQYGSPQHSSPQQGASQQGAAQYSTARSAESHEAYTTPPYHKKRGKSRKERTLLERKSGKAIKVILTLISIALFVLSANAIIGALRDILGEGLDRWADLFLGVFYLVGGFISFFTRNIAVKRFARYKRYFVFVSDRDIVPISEISRASGLSFRVVRRDIRAMINEGYLSRDAYIDKDLDSLILSYEAVDEACQTTKDAWDEPAPATPESPANQSMATILELRKISAGIADISISDKIYRIEQVAGLIFRTVEDYPEKLPQIRRFSSYYLPTTMKLLRAYAMLEKQGIDGENITTTKENIERILDTLVKGFEQQLDQLFRSDALDIATDIDVLENLLQQDGLA